MRPDDRELDEELRGHLALSIQERIERGEDPDRARRAALADLGYVPAVRDSMRRVWYNRWSDAIAGLARGAIDTAKSVLGIHSPSKEFADIADDTTEGFTGQVEKNTPEAHDAVRELVAPSAAELPRVDSLARSRPANDTAAWSGDAPAGADNSSRVEIKDNTFNFYGVQNAEHAAELIEDALTRVLEGDALAAAGAA